MLLGYQKTDGKHWLYASVMATLLGLALNFMLFVKKRWWFTLRGIAHHQVKQMKNNLDLTQKEWH